MKACRSRQAGRLLVTVAVGAGNGSVAAVSADNVTNFGGLYPNIAPELGLEFVQPAATISNDIHKMTRRRLPSRISGSFQWIVLTRASCVVS